MQGTEEERQILKKAFSILTQIYHKENINKKIFIFSNDGKVKSIIEEEVKAYLTLQAQKRSNIVNKNLIFFF